MSRFLSNRSFLNSSNFVRKFTFTRYPQSFHINSKAITLHTPLINNFTQILRHFQHPHKAYATHAPLNFNKAALTKDVIIFKYENPRFFKIVNIFGIVQLFVLTYVAESIINGLRNVSPNKADIDPRLEKVPDYMRETNFGENKWRYGMSFGAAFTGKMLSILWILLIPMNSCFWMFYDVFECIGLALLSTAWMYTLRSVRYLILRKGGNHISFVTYGPFGTNRIMDVPLSCVSAVRHRSADGSTLPLKVKNRKFHYLLDSQGEYRQKDLFDYVVNVKRRFHA